MRLILNEKSIVDKALNEGVIDKNPTNTLKVLSKHYFGIGMDKNQVRASLEAFMYKNYSGFNSVKWKNKLDYLIKTILKQDWTLRNVNDICITESELNTIKALKSERLEKLAFVLLVYAKIYNQLNHTDTNWVNCDSKDIYADCKIPIGLIEQQLLINKLYQLGLVSISKKVDCTNIKVEFVNDNSPILIKLNNFNDFVYEYLKWKGEDIGNCEECGKLFRKKAQFHKYCKRCAREKQLLKYKNYNKKRI